WLACQSLRSRSPTYGCARNVDGCNQSVVARGSRSTCSFMFGRLLSYGLRRTDKDTGPQGTRDLLLCAISVEALPDGRHQRTDRAPTSPQCEWATRSPDSRAWCREDSRSPAATLSQVWQGAGLPR